MAYKIKQVKGKLIFGNENIRREDVLKLAEAMKKEGVKNIKVYKLGKDHYQIYEGVK